MDGDIITPQDANNKVEFPSRIPVSKHPQIHTGLNLDRQHMSDRSMQRQPDGSLKSDKPKGSLRKPINWRDEADRRGNRLIAVVNERKLMQQLLLQHCLNLEKYGFTCDAGPLEMCEDFQQIKSFAAGVGHIKMPLLEDMPKHGVRGIKRVVFEPENETLGPQVHVYLECGHIPTMDRKHYDEMDEKPRVNATMPCDLCTEMLKAKGIYENPQDSG